MKTIFIRPYQAEDEDVVIRLWQSCGLLAPQNDPRKDILRKICVNPEGFLLGLCGDRIIATCMVGYEGHRGWINYLAVAPEFQRQGVATLLMQKAEELLRKAQCPKINLQIRSTNAEVIRFYETLGFLQDPVISMGKRLESDINWNVETS